MQQSLSTTTLPSAQSWMPPMTPLSVEVSRLLPLRHLECHVRMESPRGSAGSSEARANSFLKLLFTLYSVEEHQLVEQIHHLTRIQLYFLVTPSYLLCRPRKHPLGHSLRQAWHPIQIVKLFCNRKSIPPTRLCSLQSEHTIQFALT